MTKAWRFLLQWFRGGSPVAAWRKAETGRRVDELLRQAIDQGLVPGLAIQVMHRGRTWLERGYGLADLERLTPVSPGSTLFRIASVSKPITATALARMVAAGQIGLEDPLNEYVPEYPAQGIRLCHLAAHMAGVRGYRGREPALNRPLSIADSLELFRDDPLLFDPGKGFLYNSFDFVLLSLAMERAAGKPFPRLVQGLVLEPLQMRHTMAEIPGNPQPGQARFYSRGRQGFRPATEVDNRFKLAGGGYLSTVGDICRLGQAYLDRAIAPDTVLREFLTSKDGPDGPTWYGLGWQVSQDAAGRPYYGHVGNGVGGYGNFYVYPEQELVIAMLMNCTDPKVQPLLDLVVEAIHLETGGAATEAPLSQG